MECMNAYITQWQTHWQTFACLHCTPSNALLTALTSLTSLTSLTLLAFAINHCDIERNATEQN